MKYSKLAHYILDQAHLFSSHFFKWSKLNLCRLDINSSHIARVYVWLESCDVIYYMYQENCNYIYLLSYIYHLPNCNFQDSCFKRVAINLLKEKLSHPHHQIFYLQVLNTKLYFTSIPSSSINASPRFYYIKVKNFKIIQEEIWQRKTKIKETKRVKSKLHILKQVILKL